MNGQRFLRQRAFINGEWVDAIRRATFPVKNPFDQTMQTVASVANCSAEDATAAVDAAHNAFKTWGFQTTAKQRGAILQKWANLLMEHKDPLGRLLTQEQGKPLAEAGNEIAYSASFFEWFAQEARRIYGDVVPPNVLGRQLFHFREPAGVAAMITPWNFPAAMIARKAAAALAAGCTCVVKPAEDTPLSALALAAIAEEAGVPKGVFNVLPSDRNNTASIGKTFCESKKISVISFTGSTNVGKILLSQSASTVKRVCLELGGNAPFIVFPTADIDAAVSGAMASKFRCSGQTCVCANRFFVHADVADEFLAKFTAAIVKTLKMGDGMQPAVTQGPLINERAVIKVEQLVQDALAKGARIACGAAEREKSNNFYAPTVLTNVTADMDVMKTEIFGPVAPVASFHSEEEVLEMANAVDNGLAGYFYSRDLAQIFRVARRLQVGMIGINEGAISTCEAAFGGVKESGLGREAARVGIDEYTEMKAICLGGL